MSNADERAYPVEFRHGQLGLTKRELFAAMAMEGLLSRGAHHHPDDISVESWWHADALLGADPLSRIAALEAELATLKETNAKLEGLCDE